PFAAAISGFVGSLGREYPDIDTCSIDISEVTTENVSDVAQAIFDEPPHRFSPKVAWRDGVRFELALRPREIRPGSSESFREGGVYVLVGGAGGIGFALSEHLAGKYKARVAWIGR